MDNGGNEVPEDEAYERNVTHKITRIDYCLVMDKVGSNINKKG